MNISRLISLTCVLAAMAALAGWLWISHSTHSSFESLPKLAEAMRKYTRDHISRAQPLPSSVKLQDLIDGKYVSAVEVRDFDNADITFYPTVNESDPQAVIVRVRMADGTQIVALVDGSIQSYSRSVVSPIISLDLCKGLATARVQEVAQQFAGFQN